MPGKILGLDIRKDYIAAVQVESSLKGYQVTSCFQTMIEDEKGLDGALEELCLEMDLKNDSCFASIPGEDISYSNIVMPFKDYKKIKQTLPFEVETVVPFPVEEMIIDFNIIDDSDQSEILAVLSKKSSISTYLSSLGAHGIEPDIIDICSVPTVLWLLEQEDSPENGLFLDIGFNRNRMILFLNSRIALIRDFSSDGELIPLPVGDGHYEKGQAVTPSVPEIESLLGIFCESVRKTIHSFGGQTKSNVNPEKIFFSGIGMLHSGTKEILSDFFGQPAQAIKVSDDNRVTIDYSMDQAWNPALMNGALALALRSSKKGRGFNLRKGEFEIKKSYFGPINEMKKAMVLLILLFIVLLFNLGADYFSLNKRYKAGEQRINELFEQILPGVKNVGYPVHQITQEINALEQSSAVLPGGVSGDQRVLDLLNDISQRIPDYLDIDASSMIIDTETVRINGDTDTFGRVDDLKKIIEPSEYFESVQGTANLDRTGDRVNFEISMQRAK